MQPNKRSTPEIRADAQIQSCLEEGVKDKKTITECCEADEAGGTETEEMLMYLID